jgi:hypothetical protein
MRDIAKTIYAAIGEYVVSDESKTMVIDSGQDEPCESKPEVTSAPNIGVPAPAMPSDCSCAKPVSYRELTKGAREIMALKAENLNVLFKEQNSNFPKIDEAKFIEFQFGSFTLLGRFKIKYIENGERFDGMVMTSWNGNVLKVF